MLLAGPGRPAGLGPARAHRPERSARRRGRTAPAGHRLPPGYYPAIRNATATPARRQTCLRRCRAPARWAARRP